MDFLSTEGKDWGFASRHETRSSYLSPERRCEQLPLPQCVLDLKSTIALLCTMLSETDLPLPACAMGAFLLAKCCSGNAGVPLRNISSSVSLWHHCLLPHWAPQVEWYLLGLDLSALVRFVTLVTEGLDKEPSHSTWVTQLWAHTFTPSTTEKPGAGISFSKEDIPQESCLEFLPVFPQEKITNPGPILAWFLRIQASELDFVHGLCSCGFTYSAGLSLIPSKAVLWRCTIMASEGKGFPKDYVSHFLGWLLPGIILPTAAMWNDNLLR